MDASSATDKPISIAQGAARYWPGYLTEIEADDLYQWLLTSTSWVTEEIKLFGRRVEVPRQVGWFGEQGRCYRYSGIDHVASGWPSRLSELVRRLAEELDGCPNFVLLNRYRNGMDYMGWHADDEPQRGRLIGSLSLGATRRFLLRRGPRGRSTRIALEHGSLLVMHRSLYHSLPRSRRAHGERINLTFRVL